MITNEDKHLIQSYKLTTIRTGIGIYGQRLLLRIVEAVQNEMENLSFKNKADIRKIDIETETDLFGDKELTMSLRSITGNTNNITPEVKEQIKTLANIGFEYESEDEWIYSSFLSFVKITKGTMMITMQIKKLVWEALMDFSKGFRKFSLDKAMSFKSSYSLRFYQLISLQTKPLTYTIDELRKMFGIENKYKTAQNFIKNTIEVAKVELDSCSPYTFDYKPVFSTDGKAGRPRITSIRFIPIYQPQFDNEEAKKQNILTQYPGACALFNAKQEAYLKEHFGITHRGIENNRALFEAAIKHKLLNNLTKTLIRQFDKMEQKKITVDKAAYLIGALQHKLETKGVFVDGKNPTSAL